MERKITLLEMMSIAKCTTPKNYEFFKNLWDATNTQVTLIANFGSGFYVNINTEDKHVTSNLLRFDVSGLEIQVIGEKYGGVVFSSSTFDGRFLKSTNDLVNSRVLKSGILKCVVRDESPKIIDALVEEISTGLHEIVGETQIDYKTDFRYS